MKRVNLTLALLMIFIISGLAQSYQKSDFGIKSKINGIEVEVQFYGPSIVRIIKWPEGTTYAKESLSVIKTPQKTVFSVKQQGD